VSQLWWWRMRAAAVLRSLAHRLDPTLAGYRVPISTPAPWYPTCMKCGVHVPDEGMLHTRHLCDACTFDPDIEA